MHDAIAPLNAAEVIQNPLRILGHPPEHGKAAVVRLKRRVVRQIEEPARAGGIRVAILRGHRNGSRAVGVDRADLRLIDDGCRGIGRRDLLVAAIREELRAERIDCAKAATLDNRRPTSRRGRPVDEGVLVASAADVMEKIRDRDRLVLVEQFHLHVAKDRAAIAEAEAGKSVGGSLGFRRHGQPADGAESEEQDELLHSVD